MTLDSRAFSWYDADHGSWRITPGAYEIRAAASSRDVRLTAEITARGTPLPRRAWSRTDTVSDILRYAEFKKEADEVLTFIRGKFAGSAAPGTAEDLMNEAMFLEMPLRALGQFGGPEGDAPPRANPFDAQRVIREKRLNGLRNRNPKSVCLEGSDRRSREPFFYWLGFFVFLRKAIIAFAARAPSETALAT